MLIGEMLRLPFLGYLREACLPVLAGLLALWALLAWPLRGASAVAPAQPLPSVPADGLDDDPPLDRWQTAKGLIVAGALVVVFVWGGWPRDVAALVGAGLLLLSQRFHSSRVMSLIDWELLILFMGLFVVNAAFAHTGLAQRAVDALAARGVPLGEPLPLFAGTLVLSNLVSNVPAVMLLLPVAHGPHVGPTLALVSTLAGNLLIVGSIANIIVVDAARREGIVIDWRRHARTGLPVTVLTLGLAAAWLAWRAA
jgi:Na+/H+ antiporter NhaD/arsenite permease-like protein